MQDLRWRKFRCFLVWSHNITPVFLVTSAFVSSPLLSSDRTDNEPINKDRICKFLNQTMVSATGGPSYPPHGVFKCGVRVPSEFMAYRIKNSAFMFNSGLLKVAKVVSTPMKIKSTVLFQNIPSHCPDLGVFGTHWTCQTWLLYKAYCYPLPLTNSN